MSAPTTIDNARINAEGDCLPSLNEQAYLSRGLTQPGGKLPLFDEDGQEISARLIEGCIEKGWAMRWHRNPIEPKWLVCKLTAQGRQLLDADHL